MRRVAQFFEAIECRGLGRIGGGAGIDDDDAPLRRADPHDFAKHRRRIGEVVHGEAGRDDREGAIGPGQRGNVALPPGDVGDALFRRQKPRPVEHGRGHVDTGRMPHMGGKAADDDAAAAGDVEHRIRGAGSGGVDQQLQGRRIGDRAGGAERRRLPGELIADQVAVGVVGHWIALLPIGHAGPAAARQLRCIYRTGPPHHVSSSTVRN